MKIPDWCAKYVGLPFAEKGRGPDSFDCWGLARYVLHEEFGVDGLPDYADAYTSAKDKASVAAAVEEGLARGWQNMRLPLPGALMILSLAGRPWHCAVVISKVHMLHVVQGANVVVERIDSMPWRDRIVGYFGRLERSGEREDFAAVRVQSEEFQHENRCPTPCGFDDIV